jgi:hypothetical protein
MSDHGIPPGGLNRGRFAPLVRYGLHSQVDTLGEKAHDLIIEVVYSGAYLH